MSRLRVSLFGTARVAHGFEPCETKITQQIQKLLAYLLLARKGSHQREAIVECFWANKEEAQARRCLSTTLWRLRQVLEPPGTQRGTYLHVSAAGEIGFNWQSDHGVDVIVFETGIRQALARPHTEAQPAVVRQLRIALRLYKGDLLEGIYDDWALRERERLRALYVDGLAYLLRYSKHRRDYDRAIDCGIRILHQDELREEIHRDMMRLYVRTGQRARAIHQYEQCCEALQDELRILPMEETRLLHQQILEVGDDPDALPCRQDTETPATQALDQLQEALDGFEKARVALRRAMPLIEDLGKPKPTQED